MSKPKLKTVEPASPPQTIEKPGPNRSLEKFKSKRAATIANVETLLTALPIQPISQAKDFVRLHPNEEEYWSEELCFANVPTKGARDTLHLIDEDLATQYLDSAKVQRFRLALATKPNDIFFLCRVPTRNADNPWNSSNLQACEQAKKCWTQATSRKDEGFEAYKITGARDVDPFPEPKWPSQSLEELIFAAFEGRLIDTADHPGLLRLIGAKVV